MVRRAIQFFSFRFGKDMLASLKRGKEFYVKYLMGMVF